MTSTSVTAVMAKPERKWPGAVATGLLFCCVCLSWGTTWLGIRIAIESVPPLTASGLRFLIAFPLFLLLALLRRDPIFFPRKARWFFVFVTLFYFGLPYYLLNFGETRVSSGLTALLFSCMPVFILAFSALVLRERIRISQMAGIVIGFGSLFMILRAQGIGMGHAGFAGVVAILTAAILHALCYVVTKKQGAHISVITYNTVPMGIAGLLLFVLGIMLETPSFSGITARSWWALAYLGVFASVGGFIAYFVLLKRLSPVVLSFVFIIFPVFAVVIGSWYEGQMISPALALYSALLLVGFTITKVPVEKLMAERR